MKPGTIAVDWDERAVYIRSYEADYWYDSRYPNVGKILTPDEWIAEHCQIIVPRGV